METTRYRIFINRIYAYDIHICVPGQTTLINPTHLMSDFGMQMVCQPRSDLGGKRTERNLKNRPLFPNGINTHHEGDIIQQRYGDNARFQSRFLSQTLLSDFVFSRKTQMIDGAWQHSPAGTLRFCLNLAQWLI